MVVLWYFFWTKVYRVMYHYFYKALFKGNSENIVVLCLKLSSKILVIVHEYPYKQIPWYYHDFWKSLTKKHLGKYQLMIPWFFRHYAMNHSVVPWCSWKYFGVPWYFWYFSFKAIYQSTMMLYHCMMLILYNYITTVPLKCILSGFFFLISFSARGQSWFVSNLT